VITVRPVVTDGDIDAYVDVRTRASEHARRLGKARFYAVVRDDDPDSRRYYGARGYRELGRMQDVELDLASVRIEPAVPDGIAVVRAAPEHDRGAYDVALEADADIPSAEPIRTGEFNTWHARHFNPFVSRDLSFVALENGRVVAFALLQRHSADTYEHSMTGVARAARGRGIAQALKQAQIAAAQAAGLAYLRGQNDLANAPVRRVNEKLGYEKRFEWVHLGGPLLA
jgi:L-amino acid N-acyltransferase YncA